MNMRGQTSKTVIVLLASTLILASSTIYFASVAQQPNPQVNPSLQAMIDQKLRAYSVYQVTPTSTSTTSLNEITVTGTGGASYTPNEALIQVSVETQDTSAEAATQANAQHVASVISALENIGISNNSIQTLAYNLSPTYNSCYSSCVPTITGYTATNSLQVNFTSSSPTTLGEKAGQIIDTAVKAGANQVNLYFGATQSLISLVTNAALHNAVASADGKAQAIATALGVSIKGVISASEGGSPYYPGPYYGVFAAAATTNSATPIVPGTQTFTESVQVVYSI